MSSVPATVQATVRHWSPETGGSALRDDGTSVVLPPGCLRDGPFRLLRVGQRVRLELVDGQVVHVDLP